jgi:hypothetical protein
MSSEPLHGHRTGRQEQAAMMDQHVIVEQPLWSTDPAVSSAFLATMSDNDSASQ